MNVICYTRVNTKQRLDNSRTLKYQERILREYCLAHNFKIIDFYTDNCAAKSFNRPEWKKLMAYVKQNKGKVDLILCLRWNRFSCHTYGAFATIKELNNLGVQINTVEQPSDLSNINSIIRLTYLLTIAQEDSRHRSYSIIMRKYNKPYWRNPMIIN